MHSDWLPYSLAGAAAIVIAACLWSFGLWSDEHAEDNWAQWQTSVVKSLSHVIERPSRPPPSTNTHLQTSQP
jgi:hypothetical protein